MSKRFIITTATLVFILIAAGIAVLLAKGYTFSPADRRIVGTGIITVTSTPDAASVFIDGHLTTATNATISSLQPKEYTVRVVKEGFIPWQSQVEVKEGLVSDLKIRLFPAIPTVYPLTFTGVTKPTLSPDGQKLAYIVPLASASASAQDQSLLSRNRKAGVWVWQMSSDQPIAFARGAEPHQIAASTNVDYSKGILRWSADSKQVLATLREGANNYLLNDGILNTEPRDITPILSSTLKTWEEDQKTADEARVLSIKDPQARKIASDSAMLKWAPDETKFMHTTSEVSSRFKAYDIETKKSYDIPDAKQYLWLPDSRHIVLVGEGQISVVDFDGTNNAVIYAGTFQTESVFAWPDSSRLIFITSFPTPTASEPNLYGINLR